jgi:hypothetical protein
MPASDSIMLLEVRQFTATECRNIDLIDAEMDRYAQNLRIRPLMSKILTFLLSFVISCDIISHM